MQIAQLAQDGTVIKYPYTIYDYKNDNQNVSLPDGFDLTTLEGFAYVREPTVECDYRFYTLEKSGYVLARDGIIDVVYELIPRDVATVKAELKAQVQAEKVRVRDGGVIVNDVLWDTDERAQSAYMRYYLGLLTDQSLVITDWKASVGVWVEMNATTFHGLQMALKEHEAWLFVWQRNKEAEIDACETVEDLKQVVIEYAP